MPRRRSGVGGAPGVAGVGGTGPTWPLLAASLRVDEHRRGLRMEQCITVRRAASRACSPWRGLRSRARPARSMLARAAQRGKGRSPTGKEALCDRTAKLKL